QEAAPASPDYVPGPKEPEQAPFSPDYVPGPEYPEYLAPSDEEVPVEDQPYVVADLPIALSLGYVADSDPEEDSEDGPVDYPADGGDGDDDEEEEEASEEEEAQEEEEEHLAPADSVVAPVVDHVPYSEETEPFETDESAPTPRPPQTIVPFSQTRLRRARKTAILEPPMSPSMEARIAEYAIPSPPLPPLPSSPLPHLPSSPLPPLPSSPLPPLPDLLFIPPVDRREDILEVELPPCKRLCLTTLASRYEVGESSTAVPRPTGDTWVDPRETTKEVAPVTLEGVNIRVTELTAVQEQDIQEIYAVIEDTQDWQTQIYQTVETLVDDSRYHYETARLLDQEALVSREAWAHSMGFSFTIHYELQGYRTHVWTQDHRMDVQDALIAALTAQVSSLQGHLATALGEIQALQAREQTRTDAPEGTASSVVGPALKKLMTVKYCPRGEIKKLEIELWNLKVKGTDIPSYTLRFQELALMCGRMFPKESDEVEKYVSGLPDMIRGNVISYRPQTMEEVIEFANDQMNQKLITISERQAEQKRKIELNAGNNQGYQQQNKRQNTGRAYTVGTGEKREYTGSLPLCTKCNYHHKGPCAPRCNKCKRIGHLACDSRSSGLNNNNNRGNFGATQNAVTCYECGVPGHFKRDCPKSKNGNRGNQHGNDNAPAKVYVVGNAGINPDSNVVTGTFLLNDCYASILFDTGADRSFVSTTFSSIIDITPTTIDHYYDVELANGKIIGINTIIRGFTLNFLNHQFNINLLPVELGSFDVIIGMDWLSKYHA
ncbi:putative reverse transcriptase domain-containing protein, partial [Tanacetum coccineum]